MTNDTTVLGLGLCVTVWRIVGLTVLVSGASDDDDDDEGGGLEEVVGVGVGEEDDVVCNDIGVNE